MKIMKLKLLREKYRITYRELCEKCRMTPQRIYEIECGDRKTGDTVQARLREAMARTVEERCRGAASLRADFEKHKDTLFDFVEEQGYEF